MQVNFEVFKQGLRQIYKQEEFTSEPFPASPFYPSDSHFDLLRLLSQSPYEQPGINEGSSFSTEPSERRFNMFIVPNEGFALSRKPHSFRLRKSHVLFPKEIHSFFHKSPLLPPQAPITRPSGSHPAEDSERIYLMAWLAVGCDLFSCHIAFFLLPPFSSLLPLPHINQRSIVEQSHFVNGKNVLSERVAAKPANSERQRSLKVNRSIAASSKPNTSPQSRVFSRKEDQKHNN